MSKQDEGRIDVADAIRVLARELKPAPPSWSGFGGKVSVAVITGVFAVTVAVTTTFYQDRQHRREEARIEQKVQHDMLMDVLDRALKTDSPATREALLEAGRKLEREMGREGSGRESHGIFVDLLEEYGGLEAYLAETEELLEIKELALRSAHAKLSAAEQALTDELAEKEAALQQAEREAKRNRRAAGELRAQADAASTDRESAELRAQEAEQAAQEAESLATLANKQHDEVQQALAEARESARRNLDEAEKVQAELEDVNGDLTRRNAQLSEELNALETTYETDLKLLRDELEVCRGASKQELG